MKAIELNEIKKLVPYFLKYKITSTNYDEETDIMYLHFKKPNHADHSEMTDDDIIIRYENNEVIGLTYLNASKKK